jgi:CubicO group peptidase (beta-lactamase class C family)
MPTPIEGLTREPQEHADRMAALPHVVGVQLAGASVGGITSGAAGGRDLDQPDALVTNETRFRPGSITKLLTATLVMQCVDDGLVALDDPVTTHVPSFRLRPDVDASKVRVGHLIAHSSGIDAADLFVDTGDGDGCLADYVALLAETGLLFEPGAWMSYCNAGFVLAGHLVELVRGCTWEDAARVHVLDPLGMDATSFVTGREADTRPSGDDVARGHLGGFGGAMAVPAGTLSSDPMCTRGLGPPGGTLESTAADLARLAASHLGLAGVPPVLSEGASSAMQQLQARAPGGVTRMAGMGLSWQVWRRDGGGPLLPRIGGANPGQSGIIATDPEARCAVVALTNSDQGINAVNAALDGFGPQSVPDDEPAPEDLSGYVGRYGSHLMEVDVSLAESGGLELRLQRVDDVRWGAMRVAGVMPGVTAGSTTGELVHPLMPLDRTTFSSPIGPIAFVDADGDGRPRLLRLRMRAQRRI